MPAWLTHKCQSAGVGGNAQRVLECLMRNNHPPLPLGAYEARGRVHYTSAEQIDEWLGAAPGTAKKGERELVRKGILARKTRGHNGKVATFVLTGREPERVPDKAPYAEESRETDKAPNDQDGSSGESSVPDKDPYRETDKAPNSQSSVTNPVPHKERLPTKDTPKKAPDPAESCDLADVFDIATGRHDERP